MQHSGSKIQKALAAGGETRGCGTVEKGALRQWGGAVGLAMGQQGAAGEGGNGVAGGGGARGVEQRDVGERAAGIVDVCWAPTVAAAIQGFVIVDVCWARPKIGLPCT